MTVERHGDPVAVAGHASPGAPWYAEVAFPAVPSGAYRRRLDLALDRRAHDSGVTEIALDLEAGRLRVGYDPQVLSRGEARGLAERHAARLLDVDSIARSDLPVEQLLPCPTCPLTVECALRKLPGVLGVSVRYGSGQVSVDYDPRTVNERLPPVGDVFGMGHGLESVLFFRDRLQRNGFRSWRLRMILSAGWVAIRNSQVEKLASARKPSRCSKALKKVCCVDLLGAMALYGHAQHQGIHPLLVATSQRFKRVQIAGLGALDQLAISQIRR